MRAVPTSLAARLDSGSSKLCKLLTIIRKDGEVLRFAESDADLTVGADTYSRMAGLTIGSIPYGLDGFSSGVDIEFGSKSGSQIDIDELRDGLFDAAEVEIREVDAGHPEFGAVQVFWGRLSDMMRRAEGGVKISAKGILSGGNQIVVDRYMPMCIWHFCDANCGLDPGDFTFSATITAIPDPYSLTIEGDATARPADAFKNGVLEFTSGGRAGLRVECRGSDGAELKTFLAHPRGIQVGDTLSILQGCGLRPVDCKAYGNFLRFGGQPNAGNAEEAAAINYIDWQA